MLPVNDNVPHTEKFIEWVELLLGYVICHIITKRKCHSLLYLETEPSEGRKSGTHVRKLILLKRKYRDWPLKILPAMGFCAIIIALFEEILTGLHITVHDLGMLLLV